MDAITAYSSSDEEDDGSQKSTEIDPNESFKVVSKLKERFPLNSAPTILGKVCINWNVHLTAIYPQTPFHRRQIKMFFVLIPKPSRLCITPQLTSSLLQRY